MISQFLKQLDIRFQDIAKEIEAIDSKPLQDRFKFHELPLARIKKIMKSDQDVRMISAQAPVIFSKACVMFILQLTYRSWYYVVTNKRRTLQKSDIAQAVANTDIFDFLQDVVPRDHDNDGLIMSNNVQQNPQHHQMNSQPVHEPMLIPQSMQFPTQMGGKNQQFMSRGMMMGLQQHSRVGPGFIPGPAGFNNESNRIQGGGIYPMQQMHYGQRAPMNFSFSQKSIVADNQERRNMVIQQKKEGNQAMNQHQNARIEDDKFMGKNSFISLKMEDKQFISNKKEDQKHNKSLEKRK